MRKLIIWVVILLIILGILSIANKYSPLIHNLNGTGTTVETPGEKVKIVTEESVVINVVKKVGPSVVTIAAKSNLPQSFRNNPFDFFENSPSQQSNEPENIGSGFIITADGLIVTNKHVVSDTSLTYTVITNMNKKYNVQKIYRDPLNDIAIIKIDTTDKLIAVELGDSSNLQVGQLVIAIGTALGEFDNSVTTGVVSGLGRGITAGSAFEGYAERLDDVIQTDAAINPGNSGGPLLNSSGQVIGVNTAVSQSGENVGFVLPINVIKDSLKNFNQTGQFNRPYLGISYQMINRQTAIRNGIPEGAYVNNIIQGSAAEKAGVKDGDIITKMDGQKLQSGKTEPAQIISKKKVGDTIKLTLWRESEFNQNEGETLELSATLENAPEQ